MTSFRIVIPARYASSRLPGKPLREIAGKPMIQRVWEVAQRAGAESTHVATDDARIEEAVRAFGGEVVMTSPEHASGTDRLAEVAEKLDFAPDDIVVNLQGDEPCMSPELLDLVAEGLVRAPQAGIATLATPIVDPGDLFDPNVVKTVLSNRSFAMYFSRAPIPWVREEFASGAVERLPDGIPFLRHIGMYAYRTSTLRKLSDSVGTVIESAEALEQLRALAMEIGIHVSVIDEPPGHGVDTEADLERVNAHFLANVDW